MTQKFVTLPREVVEQAIDALYCTNSKEGSPTYNFELKAIKELRAALEQQPTTEKSLAVEKQLVGVVGWRNHIPNSVTVVHWTGLIPPVGTELYIGQQPQVVRETAPDGATHIQPQQGAFYKRVDEKWYVWSRMEDGRPRRWYISPGTVESCLKPISAATEQPQNHVPDVGNMVQSGWKLVPVEPTVEMLRAGCGSESPAMFRESLRRETDGQKTVEMVEKIIQRNLNSYRAMLAAAPQPQGEQEICCKIWSVNRIDDLGKIVDSSGRLIATVYGSQADKIVACHNSYTQQRPKREPLTHYEIHELFRRSWDDCQDGDEIKAFARAIEAAHNIK